MIFVLLATLAVMIAAWRRVPRSAFLLVAVALLAIPFFAPVPPGPPAPEVEGLRVALAGVRGDRMPDPATWRGPEGVAYRPGFAGRKKSDLVAGDPIFVTAPGVLLTPGTPLKNARGIDVTGAVFPVRNHPEPRPRWPVDDRPDTLTGPFSLDSALIAGALTLMVMAHAALGRRGRAVWLLLPLVVVFAPVFATPSRGYREAELSRIKQTALAIMIYTSDYDERFPRAERWETNALPYFRSVLRPVRRGEAFAYRPEVAGTSMDDPARPMLNLVIGDGPDALVTATSKRPARLRLPVASTDGGTRNVPNPAVREE